MGWKFLAKAAAALVLLSVCGVGVSQETDSRVLQRGFGEISLGMTVEQVKDSLGTDPNFNYRGDADVSFLPNTQIPLIESQGNAFIEKGLFQFDDTALYVITLLLNRTRLDYFSVYQSLVAQYGEPERLDPSSSVWENQETRIILERPATVKYLDRARFEQIVESGELEDSLQVQTTERFLEQL